MKNGSVWLLTGLLTGLFSININAAETIIQFSALAVQSMPGRPGMQARIFVGNNAVRNEYEVNGQKFMEIVYRDKPGRIMINPARKEYAHLPGGNPPALPVKKTHEQKNISPCKGIPNVRCHMIGKEMINGREAEKWEFISKINNRDVHSLHWIDVEKRFLLRQYFPDGSTSDMRKLGYELVNGRKTEKWQLVKTQPDGTTLQSLQWHDLELNIAIREEMPGGYVRELKDIRIAPQPASLFVIPADYKEISQASANMNHSGGDSKRN